MNPVIEDCQEPANAPMRVLLAVHGYEPRGLGGRGVSSRGEVRAGPG